ncbi:hypothetical protein MTP99_018823 [Tenebrio molitor]|nr:hypothetical protein MTP99_018823 [Tenebrio molitor]
MQRNTGRLRSEDDAGDLLPGRHLSYVAADIGTNPPASGLSRSKSSLAAQAIRVMTEMRDNGTVAFIGPDDTCSSEALVAAAWNLPMISYKCSDTRVSDKKVFFTFARTLPPSSKVSKSVVALLRAFQWHRFVVVSGTHPASASEVQEAIEELSIIHGLTVTDIKQYSDYIPHYIEQMDNIVADTYMKTREVTSEAVERMIRAKNVIIYGVPESSGTAEQGQTKDAAEIRKIISAITPEAIPQKIIRIGKPNSSNTRLLKVSLSNDLIAKESATFLGCVGCSGSTCNSPVCSLGCTARPQPPQKKTATASVRAQ